MCASVRSAFGFVCHRKLLTFERESCRSMGDTTRLLSGSLFLILIFHSNLLDVSIDVLSNCIGVFLYIRHKISYPMRIVVSI